MTDELVAEADRLDLTPRDPIDAPRSRRRVVPLAVLVVVVAALGFVLFRTLGDSALFFYNADEAIERRAELVGQRFRVQGTPFGTPVTTEIDRDGRIEPAVVFPIAFEGRILDVVHVGSPAELFQPGVPIVLEGSWTEGLPTGVGRVSEGANDGWHFASTDMVVKHDNEYRNDNSDRIDDAERRGFAPEP